MNQMEAYRMRLYHKYYVSIIKNQTNDTNGINKYIVLYGVAHKCKITKNSIILHCGESKYDKNLNHHKEISYFEYLIKHNLNKLVNKFNGHIYWWS